MIYSAERMNFIAEYISSYRTKIELLNKQGLFDNATLFELFAEKVCSLWFGQGFSNLNANRANYPYVDLVSDDKRIFVQVSTDKNISNKIKTTLEKIRDSKSVDSRKITNVYFFMLGNATADRIRDYAGKDKIGNIEFKASENLITADSVLNKAKTNLDFQIHLYKLLLGEISSVECCIKKLSEAIELSKELINENIDYRINNEYEIDRSTLIKEIKSDDSHFISIQGAAGAGKSALCKKILQDEKCLLYVRAEKIADVNSIDELWNVDFSEIIEYIGENRLVIYIDALEFLADQPKTKFDLLQQIYIIVSKKKNVVVLSSCRTSDKSAFIKIDNMFSVKTYTVDFLDNMQLLKLCERYSVISELSKKDGYSQLLRSPFYLNLIVTKIKNLEAISDINDFRNIIWKDIICLDKADLPQNIKKRDIKDAVEKIVVERATRFLTGIDIDDIGTEISTILQSHGVTTICEGNRIRLKYDIFEDICFERIFDKYYGDSKGVYPLFYSQVESLGKCAYRRYQIWVENKLFTKENRQVFLYCLLNTEVIPKKWKEHTIVGIVKSTFCSDFFEEYEDGFSNQNLMDFIRLTNLFAFEASILRLKNNNVYLKHMPIGKGRECLIRLLLRNKKYHEKDFLYGVVKLCMDYSASSKYDTETAECACKILESQLESDIEIYKQDCYRINTDILERYLLAIYSMAKYATVWIKSFWRKMASEFLSRNKQMGRLADDFIKYTLKNTTAGLADSMPTELCELANVYWFTDRKDDENQFLYRGIDDERSAILGFSDKGGSYHFEFKKASDNVFLHMLCGRRYWAALNWIIETTNHISIQLQKNMPDAVSEIEVTVNESLEKRSYLCNPDFWFVGVQEYRVHELISDAIYILTSTTFRYLSALTVAEKADFADKVKNVILSKSNNIMPLTIIAAVGSEFKDSIPGYAICLAGSMELLYLDMQKAALLRPNANRDLLEKQVLLTVGLPDLESRYNIDKNKVSSLQEYMCSMQLIHDEKVRGYVYAVLDYLYSKYPNEGETVNCNLQIQKMDLRNLQVTRVAENYLEVSPEIKGEAKRIVEENEKSNYVVTQNEFGSIINEASKAMENKTYTTEDCLNTIDRMIKLKDEADVPYQIEEFLYVIMAYALSKADISIDKRSQLCSLWLDGFRNLLDNGTFACDPALAKVYFSQDEKGLNDETRRRLEEAMIDCLLYRGQHGIIRIMARYLKEYLETNKKLAKKIFYTVIALAEDEMKGYKYEASKISTEVKDYVYIPNRQPHPFFYNSKMQGKKKNDYKSQRKSIIEKYLYSGEKADFSCHNTDEYDLSTLCYVANCGLELNDSEFYETIKAVFYAVLETIHEVRAYHEFLDFYALSELEYFFGKELSYKDDCEKTLEVLFDGVDFNILNNESSKIYKKIAGIVMCTYFDAHSNPSVRQKCKKVIIGIEHKLLDIKSEWARNELTSMLLLTTEGMFMSDWNKCNSSFSYSDKMFLNEIWGKYAYLNFRDFIMIIYQFHISELLPEVLIAMSTCFDLLKKNNTNFVEEVKEAEFIINEIITKAYLDFCDEIKSRDEISSAYENVLNCLIDVNFESAAVLLDNYIVH